ncbi:mitogen-activated protein kinase kinase 2-like [Hevea brasiliensis]|uniref:mitogen-activated protein kinase kinase 2-like n=1 Tax=Hevea brasiliensis TaxID=3981 RepID=UPI0025F5B50A|nr:mitogen-activated protein kinase kinase 2-like [Hevea brasiliensis]
MASTSGQANTCVGTYHYMSPERISSEISEGSHNYKSDIWSMGIVLLECATGQFPYSPPDQGEVWANVFELMGAIVEQPEPRAPSDQFSPEFCSFISSCLQKDPKNRLSTRELLTHPFMNKYENLQVDFSSYFTKTGSP